MKDIRNTVAKILEIEAAYAKAQQSEDYQIIDGLIKSAVLDHIGDREGLYYNGFYVENGKFYGNIADCRPYYEAGQDYAIPVDVNKVNMSQGDGWKLITADTEYEDEDERLEAIAHQEYCEYHAEKRAEEEAEEYARQETLLGQCPDIPYE